ncbi:hypothetical protein [Natronomonas sp. EA1]|uniref:hypothetical protein n=1 Tax=Natronomonas sp. EA1 TaxID=3421655 RepID=UPI003EB98F8D
MAPDTSLRRLASEPAFALAVVLALLVVVFTGVVGDALTALYNLLYLAVVAVVLWLFYRLVVAVEELAEVQAILAEHETDDD